MTINYDDHVPGPEHAPDEDATCEECGVRVSDHGDVCDPRALDEAARDRDAERVRDMDRDDWEANGD